MVCNFKLDNFIITNTRSVHTDTDYVTVSVTVGNNPAITKTQAMGDLNNGTHAVGLTVSADIPTDVPTPVVFSFVIMNNGHSNQADLQKGVESTLAQLGKVGASAVEKYIAQPIGNAIGATIGATIGTLVVPIIGSALGALAGWLTTEIGGLLFANCDGIVAAGVRAYVSTDLLSKLNNGGNVRDAVDHPGVTSPHGCGSNSHYATNTVISGTTVITPVFDLNGRYTAGGVQGPIIRLNGNAISVDMSAYHRPSASGKLILQTYAQITFPDDKTVPNGTYDVYFTAPNTLTFQQNKSSWQKTANL